MLKRFKVTLAATLAAGLGYAAGIAGTAVEHRNEPLFGAMYSRHQHDWLAAAVLPGVIIAELRSGYDWRVDEAWHFRSEICLWNGILWSTAVLAVAIPFKIGRVIRDVGSSSQVGQRVNY